MIELSLDCLKEISYDIDKKNDDELNEKYNINIIELEDAISEHVDQSYLDNDVYHMFPIVTMGMLALNAMLILYLNP